MKNRGYLLGGTVILALGLIIFARLGGSGPEFATQSYERLQSSKTSLINLNRGENKKEETKRQKEENVVIEKMKREKGLRVEASIVDSKHISKGDLSKSMITQLCLPDGVEPMESKKLAIIAPSLDEEHEDLSFDTFVSLNIDEYEPTGEWLFGTSLVGLADAISTNFVGIESLSGGMPELIGIQLGAQSENGNNVSVSAIESGINEAVVQGAEVILLPFGSSYSGCIPSIQEAIDQANTAGARVVVAAGNTPNQPMGFPGMCDGVTSVGSTGNLTDSLAYFSSYGADINVRGVNLTTTWPNDSYGTVAGTGPSAAIVAGLYASGIDVDALIEQNDNGDNVVDLSCDQTGGGSGGGTGTAQDYYKWMCTPDGWELKPEPGNQWENMCDEEDEYYGDEYQNCVTTSSDEPSQSCIDTTNTDVYYKWMCTPDGWELKFEPGNQWDPQCEDQDTYEGSEYQNCSSLSDQEPSAECVGEQSVCDTLDIDGDGQQDIGFNISGNQGAALDWMVENACDCVQIADMNGGSGLPYFVVDGVAYPGYVTNWNQYCGEQFGLLGLGDVYMIGECESNLEGFGYGPNSQITNPDDLDYFVPISEFSSSCDDGPTVLKPSIDSKKEKLAQGMLIN